MKGKTICTYCNGGHRGNIGADELNKAGFNAVTIEGGYMPPGKRLKRRTNNTTMLHR
jgi:predicted sulfurtransferase